MANRTGPLLEVSTDHGLAQRPERRVGWRGYPEQDAAPARRGGGSAHSPLQPPFQAPLPLPNSPRRLDSGQAEPHVEASVPRPVPGAERRPALRVVVQAPPT